MPVRGARHRGGGAVAAQDAPAPVLQRSSMKPHKQPREPVDGVLLLDKPKGLSSNDALVRARRLLNARKAGHGGTLDPMATGLLPLLFGEATKFAARLARRRQGLPGRSDARRDAPTPGMPKAGCSSGARSIATKRHFARSPRPFRRRDRAGAADVFGAEARRPCRSTSTRALA